MKSKDVKAKELKSLRTKLPKSKVVVFTSFSPSTHSGQVKTGEKGLSVAQMTQLKRLLRELSSEYLVIKKTLIDLATKDKNYDGLDIYGMEGSVGLVLGNDDPYKIAKSVYEFSRKNPALNFWGAIMDGKFIDMDAFLEIAKMPSREALLGRLVVMLTYPIRGLAVALSEIAKQQSLNPKP